MKKYQLWINGRYVDPVGGQWLDTSDPYHGEVWAQIPRGGPDDVDRAVKAAKHTMEKGAWATMTATERGKIMRRIGDVVLENAERLAEIEVRDNGKILAEIMGQMKFNAEYWYYYAGLTDKIEGSVMPLERRDMLGFTRHEPIGVVAALTAWNSPLLFLAIKCAPALAAGCSVVVKPSEFASATSLAFGELTKQAGLPDGVLNVITGLGAEVGSPLVDHPGVSKITFTGSDVTGVRVYQAAAKTMKRVALELGGKSANIVFEDADLDKALVGSTNGIFGASGQMCIAGSRLLVQRAVVDRFTEMLVKSAHAIRMGDPMDPATQVGPITTGPQYDKVLEYIDVAKADGARLVTGGKPATGAGLKGGRFVEPTIFADVKNDMRIAREEVFGPILSIIPFDTEEEAIEIANDSIYGLVGAVWTRDMGRSVRMANALKVGTVWVNTYRSYSLMMPFGGVKHSGIGRESGIEAVHEFLETKSVLISTDSGTA